MPQTDEDLAVFAQLSAEVQATYVVAGTDPWEASPFAWIKKEPSRRVGAIGEALVRAWARHEGISVSPAVDSGHDCVLDGIRVEVKFSTLWASGDLVFQQIRDQSYQVAALLGIEPQSARLWVVQKHVIWEQASGQHTGAAAVDTKWLRFRATSPPEWLAPCGGTLAEGRAALEEARRSLGL